MKKNVFLGSLIGLSLVIGSFAYAGKVELTTYYPAPNGEYSKLSATGKTTEADDVEVFKAVGSGGEGLVVTNDGVARANNGLVVQNCDGSAGDCPTADDASNGQVWLDTSVVVPNP